MTATDRRAPCPTVAATWPKGEMVNGAQLREMREAAGIGLRAIAEAIGKDRGHLSRVERGDREATPAIVHAYRKALAADTLDDMRRRDVLALGAALPALAVTGGPPPSRVGAREVAAVRQLALNVDMSHALGVRAARSALNDAAAMLHSRADRATMASLRSSVALLADRVGWGLFETGQDPSTVMTFAYRTAETCDDRNLLAHSLLDLGVATRNPGLALVTLDHAASQATGGERVNVHAVAARIASKVDPRAAREHVAQALDIEPARVDGDWADRITNAPGHLDAIVGFALHATGHTAAYDRLTAAVAGMAPGRRRTRARCYTRLASLALREGDPILAADHIGRARAAGSTMVRRDLADFATEAQAKGYGDLARLARAA